MLSIRYLSVHFVETCPTLEDMKHGTVERSNGYEVGSIATYECNEPWEMNGHPTRVCLPDATWSGEKPQCEGTCMYVCVHVFAQVVYKYIFHIILYRHICVQISMPLSSLF